MLTPRQREVIRLQAYGMTYQEVANQLGVSFHTVRAHHREAARSMSALFNIDSGGSVRSTLACYVLGLLDAGMTPMNVARR